MSDILTGRSIKNGIEIVLFNGEDYYSAPGETIYLEKYLHMFASVKLAVNCDGIGYKEGKDTFSCFSVSDRRQQKIRSLASGYPDLEETEPWYQGDHMLFAMHQVPTIACTSSRAQELLSTIIHTDQDTLELLDISRLLEMADFFSKLAEAEL